MQRLYEVTVQTSEMFFWTENCWFSVKTLNYESTFLLVTPSSHLGWKGWVEIRAGGFRAMGGFATHSTQIWRRYTCPFCLQTLRFVCMQTFVPVRMLYILVLVSEQLIYRFCMEWDGTHVCACIRFFELFFFGHMLCHPELCVMLFSEIRRFS